jgi:hypothetical protein
MTAACRSRALNAELQGYRVYSMSKRYDNMGLWAKYAADHTGYCLEFANEGPLFTSAREVAYRDSIPMSVTSLELRSGDWLFCKRPDWSNEEEVRLVLGRGLGSKVRIEPHWLTRLILGWRMLEDNRREIREWAEQREPQLKLVSASYDDLYQVLTLKP